MNINFQEACKGIERADSMTGTELIGVRDERLRRLVAYAKSNSPVFDELYHDIDPSDFTLDMLPVTDKKMLSARQDDWFTDPRLTLSVAEEFLAQEQLPGKMLLDSYSVLTTSGSSGKPMLMVRDSCHNNVHAALMQLRLLKGLDKNILNPACNRIASVIFTSGHVSSYSSFLRMQKAHPEFANNMIAISVLEPVADIVARLNDFRPEVLTGYPSVLAMLAKKVQAGNLNIQPKMVACSAEVLTRDNYRLLCDAFGCRVLNNYCSTEGGELAMSCPEGHLHINSDWVILEGVDKNGRPVPDGEMSEGVLVTDLSNFVQPVIRYYVNDQVRISHEPCPCGSNLPTVEIIGRQDDSFTFGTKSYSSVPIVGQVSKVKGVIEFQFLQLEDDIVQFLCVPAENYSLQDIERQVRPIFDSFLAANGCTGICLSFSDNPPVKNSRGGKTKCMLNLCKKQF